MTAVGTFAFKDLLNAGCGTGATLGAIVSAHPDVRVRRIDIPSEMIGVARGREWYRGPNASRHDQL
jgi:predicted TPR repeat methyltransferase